MKQNGELVTILLVEDDEGHAMLIKRNLGRSGIDNEIVHFADGLKVVEYLEDEDNLREGPFLMLLDLNLPVLDGAEVLNKIRNNKTTKHIPIIILTTTDEPSEIKNCYDLGCNVYITKPVEYSEFTEAVRKLGLFLTVIKMP